MATAHAFTHVKGPLQVPDALANALDVLKGQIPARDRVDQTRIVVVEHAAKAALADEAALRQSIAHGSEMLVFDSEFGLTLGGRIVVVGGVLQGGPGIMMAATACGSGVADAHAL